ncbi:MAG: GH3 auxin-responsive promoter family protein, partial [Perlabentimonas sp.]
EFSKQPNSFDDFQKELDQLMQKKNPYYSDLINGKILKPLQVHSLPRGTFIKYMKSIGKLGGQNKVPHLKNDRSIADKLMGYL